MTNKLQDALYTDKDSPSAEIPLDPIPATDPHSIIPRWSSFDKSALSRARSRWSPLRVAIVGLVALLLVSVSWLRATSRTSDVAFVTLLSVSNKTLTEEQTLGDMERDKYFTAARILCYQLLHHPQTRNRLNAPCIVMVTPDVSQAKIDRLVQDGATVQRIEKNLEFPAYRHKNDNRYIGVWNKLLIWKMTQYKRIIFIDNDAILLKPLDGILKEPSVFMQRNRKNPNNVRLDEAPQPDKYLFSGIQDIGATHEWPWKAPDPSTNCDTGCEGRLNAGFMVIKPDPAMFDYFTSVLATPGKFNNELLEQNFLQHIFHADGNMPMSMIHPKWDIRISNYEDVVGGAHGLHEKWWVGIRRYGRDRDFDLEYVVQSWRWRMEGFYLSRDADRLNKVYGTPSTKRWQIA